jgi:hypothetical protein
MAIEYSESRVFPNPYEPSDARMVEITHKALTTMKEGISATN